MTPILYLGCNTTDLTVTFSIAGVRWEYYLATPADVDSADFLARRWQGKGLAWAKKRARREERLN